ncbi:MAG: CvpA family protein [Actinomycetota bacterium]|nr:CvpA family protein [Actinomycetota bacterium]
MNLVDVAFAAFVAFYAYRGFHRGIVREGLDLVGFAIAIAVALRVYQLPAAIFKFFGANAGWANVIGGALIFILFVVASAIMSSRVEGKMGAMHNASVNKVGGAAFAFLWSAMFAAFLLVVVTVIPSPEGTRVVRSSFVGRTALAANSPIYPLLDDYAKHEARNVLLYLRQYFAQLQPAKVEKQEGKEEFFKLTPSNDISIDAAAEKQIFDLVNRERTSRGLGKLNPFNRMREVARAHSADMYRRGYFAHIDPDGRDPFQRMEGQGISFSFAGENLALAPTITLVHQGLMNSPKHKENILKPEFTDLGIGVYKGPYGLMVTQNFCAGCTP